MNDDRFWEHYFTESLESGDTFAITASTGDIFTSTFDKDPYTLANARMVEAVKWVVVEDARHVCGHRREAIMFSKRCSFHVLPKFCARASFEKLA